MDIRTCAIVSWSSLQSATIDFLALSISSKEAPSDTPNSLSALSTDISEGAESSALEPAWRVTDNVRRVEEVNTRLHSEVSFLLYVFPIRAVSGW